MQKTAPLFDDLVGGSEQIGRHAEAERLGGLEIDGKLELRRQLHGQVGRLLALEDAIDMGCRAPEEIGVVDSIGGQAVRRDHVSIGVDRRNAVTCRERDDQLEILLRSCGYIRHHNEARVRPPAEAHDDALDVGGRVGHGGNRLDPAVRTSQSALANTPQASAAHILLS